MKTAELEPKDRIIVALDVDSPEKALALVDELTPFVGCFKIGLQFIYSALRSLINPEYEEAVENLSRIRSLFVILACKDFWDVKLDDIPNTLKGASITLSDIGVEMFNLHASAGSEAIAKAVENKGKSLVLGVTVLTSIGESECRSIFGDTPKAKVIAFAEMLKDKGVDGIICSPQELEVLRENPKFDDLLMVTPGIRPAWAVKGDQSRIMTPADAIKAGADYLVIGRPIREPPEQIGSPAEAARRIAEEIASVS